jgi:transcriptional regulator with XRE-family HTH domain
MDSLDSEQSSVFSAYLKEKILEKGWSIKEFASHSELAEKYVYRLVSPKRDFVPSDETLDKILKALDLNDEEGQYIVDLILLEQQVGDPVYPGHPDLPTPPVPQPVPQPEPPQPEPNPPEPPQPPAPQPGPSPPEPVPPPSPPGPAPHPPAPPVPVPVEQLLWYKRKDVMVALFVGLLVGSLTGCCSMWTIFHLFILGKYNWGF